MQEDKTKENQNIVAIKYTNQDILELIKHAEKGNLQAKISLVLHNQRILNLKLNKILKVDKK